MEPFKLPGAQELLDRQRGRLVEKIGQIAADGPEDFLAWVQQIVDAEGLDPEQIAAAALRLAWGERPLAAEGGEAGLDPADVVEIVVPVGTLTGVRPSDVVGAIAESAGLPGKIIGRVNMLERVTFVEVPAVHAQRILEALTGTRIGGRVVRPRLAHPEGGPATGGKHRPKGRGPKRGPRGPRKPPRGPR